MIKKLDPNLISSKSIIVDAGPEKVWETLTNPSLISQYLFGAKTITDWKPESSIQFVINFEDKEFIDKGVVIENVENIRLKYRYWSGFCGLDDEPQNYAMVSYDIERIENNQCKLSWTQTGFVDDQSRTSSENSLVSILQQVKMIAETGIST